MFKVSHQIINEKTVQVYCTLQCTLVFFMIAFIHSAQQCSENDLVTAESQLVLLYIYLPIKTLMSGLKASLVPHFRLGLVHQDCDLDNFLTVNK